MTELEKAFYIMDYATDLKALCEKSENLNKELKRKQKQIFNNFLAQARMLLTHLDKAIPTDDPTFLSMENFKYDITLDLKKQFTEQIEKHEKLQ